MIVEIVIALTLMFGLLILLMLAMVHAKQWERYGGPDTASRWKPTRRRRKHAFSGRSAARGKEEERADEPWLSPLRDDKGEKQHDLRLRPGGKYVVSNANFRSHSKK